MNNIEMFYFQPNERPGKWRRTNDGIISAYGLKHMELDVEYRVKLVEEINPDSSHFPRLIVLQIDPSLDTVPVKKKAKDYEPIVTPEEMAALGFPPSNN